MGPYLSATSKLNTIVFAPHPDEWFGVLLPVDGKPRDGPSLGSGSWFTLELRLELPQIPIVAPRGDLSIAQFEDAHTWNIDLPVSALEAIDALGHYHVSVCHDVANFPGQGGHLLGATAERLPNGIPSFDWAPWRIPPDGIFGEKGGELFGIGTRAGVNELTDECNAVSIFQDATPKVMVFKSAPAWWRAGKFGSPFSTSA